MEASLLHGVAVEGNPFNLIINFPKFYRVFSPSLFRNCDLVHMHVGIFTNRFFCVIFIFHWLLIGQCVLTSFGLACTSPDDSHTWGVYGDFLKTFILFCELVAEEMRFYPIYVWTWPDFYLQ